MYNNNRYQTRSSWDVNQYSVLRCQPILGSVGIEETAYRNAGENMLLLFYNLWYTWGN